MATEILEDVALARLFRNAGQRVYFRYGGDAVRTRMYRNWAQLREGWTKNLALLFPQPGRLALQSVVLWFAAWFAMAIAAVWRSSATTSSGLRPPLFGCWCTGRIRAAHFTTANNLLAIAVRSADVRLSAAALEEGPRERPSIMEGPYLQCRRYQVKVRLQPMQAARPIASIENQKLRTEN